MLSGIAAAAALGAWPVLFGRRAPEVIAMILRRRLDYLELDPDGVRQFARDIATLNVISRSRLYLLAVIAPAYSHFSLSSGHSNIAYALRHGEDRIVSTYLISSDFFINGSDTTRVVRYLGMLDPLRACGNPFARRVA